MGVACPGQTLGEAGSYVLSFVGRLSLSQRLTYTNKGHIGIKSTVPSLWGECLVMQITIEIMSGFANNHRDNVWLCQ